MVSGLSTSAESVYMITNKDKCKTFAIRAFKLSFVGAIVGSIVGCSAYVATSEDKRNDYWCSIEVEYHSPTYPYMTVQDDHGDQRAVKDTKENRIIARDSHMRCVHYLTSDEKEKNFFGHLVVGAYIGAYLGIIHLIMAFWFLVLVLIRQVSDAVAGRG